MIILRIRKKAEETYHSGLGGSLHSDLGVGIDSEALVEDAIRDLIAQFVGVTLSDGLGGEVHMILFVALHY